MSKKLHILFLSSWYPSKALSSNGDFVQRHAEAVATRHQVTIIHVVTFAKKKHIERTSQVINNVKTIIVYVPKTWNPIYKFWLFLYYYYIEIKKLEKIDIVHHNVTYPVGIIALWIKIFNNIPYIISEHWSGYQIPQCKSVGFVEKILTKLVIKHAAFVCPVSKNLEIAMCNMGFKGNYYPIPNVVNTSIFYPEQKQNNLEFIITHVSGMDDHIKNVTGIINVISKIQNKIPNLIFNLIGPNSSEYLDLIEIFNINNINIIDEIPHSEVSKYLKDSNLFVLFSNYENLPCVILEAFACGVPVISTDVGGVSEFFPSSFGSLIKPRDEYALENAILKIFNNEIKIEKSDMSYYAENNFGIDTICSTFSKLYKRALNY